MERADEVDVGGEDRNRVALLRRLQRLLARLGHGVVEADDAVFLDLQGFGAHGALVADGRADARRPVACQWEGDSAKMSAVMDTAARTSVVSGKSVSVRVDLGGGRLIKKKKEARSTSMWT